MISTPTWELRLQNRCGETAIAPVGELDLCTGAQLRQAVASLPEAPQGAVIIDLSGVTFIDVAGVRAICEIVNVMRARNRSVRVVPGSPAVQRLFRMTDAEDRLPFITSGGARPCSVAARPARLRTVRSAPVRARQISDHAP